MKGDPLRIVQISNTLSTSDGGPARNAFELNLALNNRGVLADLFWLSGEFGTTVARRWEESGGLLPEPGPHRLAARKRAPSTRSVSFFEFTQRTRRADAAIVHGYYLLWVPMFAALCAAVGTPFVITPHGALTRKQQKISPLKKALFEWVAGWWVRRLASMFVTGSAEEAEELRSRFPRSRVELGGVGTALIDVDLSAPRSNPLALISISRIAPKKRIDLMLDAVSELGSRDVRVHLTVAGSGDAKLLQNLNRQAQKLGISDQVDFVGEVSGEAKEALFGRGDIFLFPSDDENFGIGLAEALAHGVPVVASTKVAAAQFMRGQGGAVIENPDGRSIADAIVHLLDGEWVDHRKGARAVAEVSFGWSSVAERWEARLCEATGEARSRL